MSDEQGNDRKDDSFSNILSGRPLDGAHLKDAIRELETMRKGEALIQFERPEPISPWEASDRDHASISDIPVHIDPWLRYDQVFRVGGTIRAGSVDAAKRVIDEFNRRYIIVWTSPACLFDREIDRFLELEDSQVDAIRPQQPASAYSRV